MIKENMQLIIYVLNNSKMYVNITENLCKMPCNIPNFKELYRFKKNLFLY